MPEDDEPQVFDKAVWYRALQTRDARFDGRFFVAVRTTGIYCRPICPAPCPKLENVVFYSTAAGAQEAGFRPCLRCRPESSPSFAAWRGSASTVARALAMISEGALDGDDAGVESLALRLGIGERQLRRLFEKHIGASPIAVAQTRRVLFAKQLIHETRLSMTDVAMAAGFGSVRRFNDTFQRMYRRPPSTLRRRRSEGDEKPTEAAGGVRLMLSYAAPYDWNAMIDVLAAHAVPSIESVTVDRYRRTIALHGCHGMLDVVPVAGNDALLVTIRFAAVRWLPAIISRVRCIFDLGADTRRITKHLAQDGALAPLVKQRPGLRVPGAWDGFELAVRTLLGQPAADRSAGELIGRLIAAHGEKLAISVDPTTPELVMVFPLAERLARADLTSTGIRRAQAKALASLARAVENEPTLFDRDRYSNLEKAIERYKQLPGIDERAAQHIALRALHEPDAFPAGDTGLRQAIARRLGSQLATAELFARSQAWRPWRAYATQHLWASAVESLPRS